MTKIDKDWLIAAGIRALKTAAEIIIGMVGVGTVAPAYEVEWGYILSAALTAVVISICMSLTGLPEVATDGTLQIDTTGVKDVYRFVVDSPLDELREKSRVVVKVDSDADLNTRTEVSSVD